jgi:hypothetical protein
MPDVQPEGLLLYLVGTWPEAERLRLLIDLDFTDPFFPFDLKVGSDQITVAGTAGTVTLHPAD